MAVASAVWKQAFAQQALCDLDTYALLALEDANKCQRLHLLQMACEKTCKAYLHAGGQRIGRTHAVIAKYLPLLVRNFTGATGVSGTWMQQVKHFAREVELLAPDCHANESRPDNAEYPWSNVLDEVYVPCSYTFPEIDDSDRFRVPLLRLLRAAAERYAR